MSVETLLSKDQRGKRVFVENREESWFMDQELKHRLASVGLRLEHFLASPVFDETKESTDNSVGGEFQKEICRLEEMFINICRNTHGLENVSEDDINLFGETIQSYKIFKLYSEDAERKLRYIWGAHGEELEPQDAGRLFFKARTGETPGDFVEMFRKEGYFILFFCHPADYSKFVRGGLGGDKSKFEQSGGLYHRVISLKIKIDRYDLTTPVLLVNGSDDKNISIIVAHERQHFLNDSFYGGNMGGKFVRLEFQKRGGKPDFFWDDYHKYAGVKDEVLAFLRDGRGGQVDSILNDKLYSNLFTPQDYNEKMSIISEIAINFSVASQIFNTADRRAVLVHRLMRVLFEDFPVEIEKAHKYYNLRFMAIRDSLPPDIGELGQSDTAQRNVFLGRAKKKSNKYLQYVSTCINAMDNYVTDPRTTQQIINYLNKLAV